MRNSKKLLKIQQNAANFGKKQSLRIKQHYRDATNYIFESTDIVVKECRAELPPIPPLHCPGVVYWLIDSTAQFQVCKHFNHNYTHC